MSAQAYGAGSSTGSATPNLTLSSASGAGQSYGVAIPLGTGVSSTRSPVVLRRQRVVTLRS